MYGALLRIGQLTRTNQGWERPLPTECPKTSGCCESGWKFEEPERTIHSSVSRISIEIPRASQTQLCQNWPKPYSFVSLGLALSEKQTPQIIEEIQKPKEQIEGLESSVVLRRQVRSGRCRPPLYAVVDRDDAQHRRAQSKLKRLAREKKEVLVAYPTLCEAYTLVPHRLGKPTAEGWLNQTEGGVSLVNATPRRLPPRQSEARFLPRPAHYSL